MNTRGIEARIVKLESRRRHDGEFYLMWRKPGADLNAAITSASLARGTKVICPEWFGELPLPIARWVNADTHVSREEEDSIHETVLAHMAKRGISEDDLRERAPVHRDYSPASEMTDVELHFAIFGVTVE